MIFRNNHTRKFIARNGKHRFTPNILPKILLFGNHKILCRFQVNGNYNVCCVPDQISKVFGLSNLSGIHKNSFRIGFRKSGKDDRVFLNKVNYDLILYSYEKGERIEEFVCGFQKGDIVSVCIDTGSDSVLIKVNNLTIRKYRNRGERLSKIAKILLPDPYFGGKIPYYKNGNQSFYIMSKIKVQRNE